MADFNLEEILRKVFQKTQASTIHPQPYLISREMHRRKYDEFFQFTKFSGTSNQKLESIGLHKILEDIFPIEINNGARMVYYGYGVEDSGRNLSQCLDMHCTYGKKIFLKLKLEGQVDIALKNSFDNGKYYIENRSKGFDVVPVMSNDAEFLITSRTTNNPPVARSPILNLGLLCADEPDNPVTYDLYNIKVYFLSDYLSREIKRELSKIKREFSWLLKGKVNIRPDDVAYKICREISICIHRCLTDSHICPPLIDINPVARISQINEVSHIGPFGVKGKRANVRRRHIHHRHYSRLCPLETPESETIGLTLHLARGAFITHDGSLNAQYGQPGGISPNNEIGKRLGSCYDRSLQGKILSKKENNLEPVNPSEVDFWDSIHGQFLGHAASIIPFIQHNDPTRATMGAKNMKQALVLSKPEEPLVKTGMETEIADNLNIGRNLIAAYMPWYGYNYEDGIVTSEKASKYLFSEKEHKTITIPVWGNEKPYCNLEKIKGYSGLTEEGIIAAGVKVETGSVIARIHEVREFIKDTIITGKFREEKVPLYVKGKVKEAIYKSFYNESNIRSPKTLSGVIKIVIAEERPLQVGDKLMGRHGNKGIVSKILPEQEMPYFIDSNGTKDQQGSPNDHGEKEAHTHVEIILNPFGVISRMNLGQIMETHVGFAALRSDKAHKEYFNKEWKPFETVDMEKLKQGLKATGIVDEMGRVQLNYWKEGKKFETKEKVVVGCQYIMKLNHMAEDKYHARNTGSSATITGQALKGRGKGGGMRLGEMEVWALQAHGALNTLNELMGEKSDDPDKTGFSRSLQAFVMYLRGIGLSLEFFDKSRKVLNPAQKASNARIFLANNDTIQNWSNGEVINKKSPKIKILQKKATKQVEAEFDTESLFSKTIFGKDEVERFWKKKKGSRDGLKMGHIKLAVPILHPMLYLADTNKSFGKLCAEMMILAKKPCNKWSKKNKKYYENISEQKKLLVINSTNSQIKEGSLITIKEYIKNEQAVKVVDLVDIIQNDNLVKKYEIKDIDKLREYLLTKIPVLPISLRPYLYDHKNRKFIIGDLNNLYSDVIYANEQLKSAMEAGLSLSYIHKFKESLEIAINNLFLLGKKDESSSFKRSISHILKGKEGLLRQSILGKRCNYSGRAVIVPEPSIEIDELVIPWEIGKVLYPKDNDILQLSEGHSKKLTDSYVILTRAPSLHKYSVQAFKPIIKKGEKVFRVNPAICQPFNADFDGDQMSIFVINRKESIKEAGDKLLPQKNFISMAGGQFLPSLSLDIRFGIYLMLQNKEGKKFVASLLGEDVCDDNFVEKLRLLSLSNPEDAKRKVALLLRRAFEFATEYGISFSMFDLQMLDIDKKVIGGIFEDYFKDYGYESRDIAKMNEPEKKKYENAVKNITAAIKEKLGIKGKNGKIQEFRNNPVSVIYTSGAKKDDKQIMQLVGVKGFLRYPLTGENLVPILNNYCKGLHTFEYFLSTFQSRNAVMDKKLKTAPCGYLTRRLISASYEFVISTEKDCYSTGGLTVHFEGKAEDKKNRWLIGRYLSKSVNIRKTLYKRNQIINEQMLSEFMKTKTAIKVRSPITCCAKQGVCACCYGVDISTGKLPEVGLPIGIIAGQSVGERLTQLAMRSYHSGTTEGIVNIFDEIQDGFDGNPERLKEKEGGDDVIKELFNDKYLSWLQEKYDYKVDSKHFEVIMRAMGNGQKRITDIALQHKSFLSAAAFGRLIEVLAEAAYKKKHTTLDGLKDRLITGRLVNG